MAKKRAPLWDFTLYAGFRLSVCIWQALPLDLACWLADIVMWIVFHIDRRHREVTIHNLRRAFPGRYSDAQLRSLALRIFRHFATCILEAAFMTRKVTARNMRRYIDAREFPPLRELLESRRPVIVLTAHYGNWELAAHWLGLNGVRSHLVARPLDNPYIDRWLRALRERTGHKVLSKSGDVRRMTELLAANETLCTLGDQDAGKRGMFVDFFGQPASTHKGIARLAERTGAAIVVVGMQKTGGLLEYAIRVMDIIRPDDYAGDPGATLAITQRFTAAIEQLIRLDPVQYFWLHDRWKHQPRAAEHRKAA